MATRQDADSEAELLTGEFCQFAVTEEKELFEEAVEIQATRFLEEAESLALLPVRDLSALQRHKQAVARYVKAHRDMVPAFEDVTMRPGHVNNLSAEQMIKLQLLWAMFVKVLACAPAHQTFESLTWKQKQAYCAEFYSTLKPLLPLRLFNEAGMVNEQLSQDFRLNVEGLLMGYYSVADMDQLIDQFEASPLASSLHDQMGVEDPDTLLLRFLRARKWNLVDALTMLVDTLYWHRSFGVGELMRAGEPAVFEYLLTCGKHYAWNVDHSGRLVIWITSRLHDKNKQTLQQNLQALVFLIEQARRLMAPGTETVTLVFDLADAPLSSLDLPSIQGDIRILQSFYPECLGACYVVDAPWLFHGLYRIVRGFLDPVVVNKIKLLDSSELIQLIHPEMVPPRYSGGKDPMSDFVHTIEQASMPFLAVSEGELQAQEAEVKQTRRALIRETLIMKAVDAFNPEGDRAMLRSHLLERAWHLECSSWPRSHYHRNGVLNVDKGRYVNWLELRK